MALNYDHVWPADAEFDPDPDDAECARCGKPYSDWAKAQPCLDPDLVVGEYGPE